MNRIVLAAATILALGALPACSNPPHPVGPNSPTSVKCTGGGYCSGRGWVCGQKGHACNENECCDVGDDGRAYGTKRKQTPTPE